MLGELLPILVRYPLYRLEIGNRLLPLSTVRIEA